MKIRINDNTIAECLIDIKNKISKKQEFLVKSLCFLILMVINNDGSKNKHKQFTDIISKCVRDSEKIYKDECIQNGDINGVFEQF